MDAEILRECVADWAGEAARELYEYAGDDPARAVAAVLHSLRRGLGEAGHHHPLESAEAVSTARAYVAQAGKCPDTGTCHHGCWGQRRESEGVVDVRTRPCFRVLSCGPLSGVFPGGAWPEAVVVAERQAAGRQQDRENAGNLERAASALRAAVAATAPGSREDPDIEVVVTVGHMQVTQQITGGVPADARITMLP